MVDLQNTLMNRVEEELVKGAEEVVQIDHLQVSETWRNALALAVHSSPLQQFGVSFGVGWLSGYLFKRVSKTAAFLLGCSFLALQGASTLGLVKVNWRRVGLVVRDRLNRVESLRALGQSNDPVTVKLIKFCERHVYVTSGFTTGAIVAITF